MFLEEKHKSQKYCIVLKGQEETGIFPKKSVDQEELIGQALIF